MLPSNCSSSFWQRFCYDLGRLRSWWSWSTPPGSLGKWTQKVHKHQSQMATFHHISIYPLVTLIDFYGIFLHCGVIPFFLLRVSIPFDDHDGQHIPLILLAPFFPDYGLWAAVAVGWGWIRQLAQYNSQILNWLFKCVRCFGKVMGVDLATWPLFGIYVKFRGCFPIPHLGNHGLQADLTNIDQHREIFYRWTSSQLCVQWPNTVWSTRISDRQTIAIDFGLEVHGQRHSYDLYSLSVWSSILLNTAVFLVKSYHFGNFPLLGSPDFGASWGYDCVSAGCFDSLPTQNLHMLMEKHRDSGPPRKKIPQMISPPLGWSV